MCVYLVCANFKNTQELPEKYMYKPLAHGSHTSKVFLIIYFHTVLKTYSNSTMREEQVYFFNLY